MLFHARNPAATPTMKADVRLLGVSIAAPTRYYHKAVHWNDLCYAEPRHTLIAPLTLVQAARARYASSLALSAPI